MIGAEIIKKDRNVIETIKLYEIRYTVVKEGKLVDETGYYIGKNEKDAIEQLRNECAACTGVLKVTEME